MRQTNPIKLALILLIFSPCAYAKKIEKKDIRLEMPKFSDGTIEVEKVEHFERVSSASITLKLSRTKKESSTTWYSCSIRDVSGNSLQDIDVIGLPKDVGIKERRAIPISSLPDDLTLPIIVKCKVKYVCVGEECKEAAQ
jgi:hypothetical protein